jgi:AcrR family transcriptional regulator
MLITLGRKGTWQMVDDESAPRRRPGRPRQTDEDALRVRESILAATEQVFAGHGHRDVTVTRIIELAGITRPNFYRYYRNAGEPLSIVLHRVADTLLKELRSAITAQSPGDGPARVVAGIDAYLSWAGAYQHLLPSILANMHDPTSPVFELRISALNQIMELTEGAFADSGRPRPSRTTVDVFLNAVEYSVYRLYMDTAAGPVEIEEFRQMMLRIALATLGRRRSWEVLAELMD